MRSDPPEMTLNWLNKYICFQHIQSLIDDWNLKKEKIVNSSMDHFMNLLTDSIIYNNWIFSNQLWPVWQYHLHELRKLWFFLFQYLIETNIQCDRLCGVRRTLSLSLWPQEPLWFQEDLTSSYSEQELADDIKDPGFN